MPGGIDLSTVPLIALTCATAASIFAPGWKKTLMTPTPVSDWLSMCSISLTVVVNDRSLTVTMRDSMSAGDVPGYCQMTVTTGMSISGKMSTGIRRAATTLMTTMSIAITTNV